jgi:hypothetical protein
VETAMLEDDLWELERLRRYATELHNLMAEAESVAPQRVEATDRSGAVRMTIGPDALPESLRIAGDWKQKLQPAAVGAAVIDAYGECVRQRVAEWTRVLDNHNVADRMRQLDQLEAETQGPAPPASSGSLPAAFRPNVGHIQARPLDLIAEDVLSAAGAAESAIAASAANASAGETRGTGSTRRGEVAITVSAEGLVSCDVDPDWAERQTAVRLTEALRTALDTARENLAAAQNAWGDSSGDVTTRLNELFSEITAATFNDPQFRSDR